MNWVLTIITIISVLLVILILLQKTNTDGLSGGDSLGINNKKRGLEKTLFQTTIVIAVLFVVFNLFALFVR